MKKMIIVLVVFFALVATACVSKKKCPAYSSIPTTEMQKAS